MFRKAVGVTALTTDSANDYFTNISGEAYAGDTTFIATLRALVAPRIPEGESIRMSLGRSDYDASDVGNNTAKRMIDAICGNIQFGNGTFYIHNLSSRSEDGNDACLKLLKEKFTEVYEGWREVEKINEFYRKSFKVICFVNESTKSAAVFVEQMNLQKWHYLQMATLAILTWYFDPAKGVSEEEMALVQSLRERESDNYEACIAKIAEKYDFEIARLKKLLHGFESRYEQAECERVRNSIQGIDRNIDDLNRRYADYNKQRNDACIRLLGLEQKIAEGGESSEIMEYFLCNRNLRLEDVNGTSITFVVRTYLDVFDENVAKRAIGRESSNVYGHTNSKMTAENIKKFMTAVFIDQTLRIRVCAAYNFDLHGSVHGQSRYHFDSSCAEYIPNAHIQQYSCMGGYESQVNNMLVKGDYIGAIQQCVASAKSLNFGDGAVMSTFMDWLVNGGTNNKCVELPNGRVVKPFEAVKWLDEQQPAAANVEETSARED